MAQPWEKEYPEPPKSLYEQARQSQFAQNVVESGERFSADIWNAVTNPWETTKAIGKIPAGVIANMTPGPDRSGLGQYADAFGHYYRDRYGSLSDLARTAYEDPVG